MTGPKAHDSCSENDSKRAAPLGIVEYRSRNSKAKSRPEHTNRYCLRFSANACGHEFVCHRMVLLVLLLLRPFGRQNWSLSLSEPLPRSEKAGAAQEHWLTQW